MDEDLKRLPVGYAEYLRLRRRGLAEQDIARRLGVEVDVLPVMRRLAEAKLQALSSSAAVDADEATGGG